MVEQQAAILRPETLVDEFKKNGVTHVVTIPDSETNYLYELMLEQDWLDVVPISREGEGPSTALGLCVAGKTPVVLIQNTGPTERKDDSCRRAVYQTLDLRQIVAVTNRVTQFTKRLLTFTHNAYVKRRELFKRLLG